MRTPDWEMLLVDLPDRACVAFAARAARRVQPCFKESWSAAPESLARLVDRAIQLAERCAVSDPGDSHSTSTFALNARTAAKAASQADCEQAANAASAAAYATYAATAIGYASCSQTHAAECAEYAVKAAREGEESTLMAAMERDIAWIRGAIGKGEVGADADAPVDPVLFGPLWSEDSSVTA